jgi:hypothetical protein
MRGARPDTGGGLRPREGASVPLDRYRRGLVDLTGEEKGELAYVWQQAGRTIPALDEFVSRRLAELGGVGGPVTVIDDLRALPKQALDRLAAYLRTVVAVQSGAGLPYAEIVALFLREERGRRVRDLVA